MWPRLLLGGGRSIKVSFTILLYKYSRTLITGLLNRGWPLNCGSTVIEKPQKLAC